MTTMQSIREAIIQEKQRREEVSESSVLALIDAGEVTEAAASLIFFTSPERLPGLAEGLTQAIQSGFSRQEPAGQVSRLAFAGQMALGLRSVLPAWNLRNQARHGQHLLPDNQLKRLADRFAGLVAGLESQSPAAAEKVGQSWLAETRGRLAAEEAADSEAAARELMGASLTQAVDNLSQVLAHSNLRRLAEMHFAGETPGEWGNDYAAYLQYAMYLGAAFVACNPVEILWAWEADPERWNRVLDDIAAKNPGAGQDTLARLLSAEVVLANMRLLRPVFLLSEGKTGSVCFQVNPKKHDDAETMIADAVANYHYLKERLNGGVPNVVFKLPATNAGLAACRALTGQGIGVTITVNFAMFQHLPFARAIHQSQAVMGCLANMSGRFAYPVRDDLLSKLDELAAYGIDEAKARQAAAWAGIAVTRKLHHVLTRNGYDVTRVRPLIASARVYEGAFHEGLPHPYMDLTEIVGINLITVFPKIRRPFDALPYPNFDGCRVEQPVPAEVLDVLARSEVFKQGYYVADREWLPDEEERFRPERPLALEDEAATAGWSPAASTLAEFGKAYDKFVERILERRARLVKG